MVKINEESVPTCRELAEWLKQFGDQPLFSGRFGWAVVGFARYGYGVKIVCKNVYEEEV